MSNFRWFHHPIINSWSGSHLYLKQHGLFILVPWDPNQSCLVHPTSFPRMLPAPSHVPQAHHRACFQETSSFLLHLIPTGSSRAPSLTQRLLLYQLSDLHPTGSLCGVGGMLLNATDKSCGILTGVLIHIPCYLHSSHRISDFVHLRSLSKLL